MSESLALARLAEAAGEVPVGAVLVLGDAIIGRGFNSPVACHDPTAHAEIRALRDAGGRQQNYRFPETVMYVTLEPCVMCASALVHARVGAVVYGARDERWGGDGSVLDVFGAPGLNHRVETHCGVLADDSVQLLRNFFRQRR